MIRKISVIYIMIMMTAVSVYAGDAASVISQLEKIRTYTADFVQLTEIEGFGEDEYSGRLYIRSGEKALWDYDMPYRQFYLFDADTMKYYDSDTKQLVVQELDPAQNVFMRLMLNPADIRDDFAVELKGDRLILSPNEDFGLREITFTVKNSRVTGIITKDQNGNNTVINLKNIEIDKEIAPSVFEPEIPEDTEIFRYN